MLAQFVLSAASRTSYPPNPSYLEASKFFTLVFQDGDNKDKLYEIA